MVGKERIIFWGGFKNLDLDHFPREMYSDEDNTNFCVVSTQFEFK